MEGQSEKLKAVNAKKMATQTIPSHSCCTPDEPEHDDCPSGRKSCDLTNGTNCHKPVKKPIPDAVVEVLQPLFDEIFLVGGQYCYTPKKETSVCIMSYGAWLPQINLAICLRVLHFNHGFNSTNTDLVGKLQGILRDLKRIKRLEDRREYTYS